MYEILAWMNSISPSDPQTKLEVIEQILHLSKGIIILTNLSEDEKADQKKFVQRLKKSQKRPLISLLTVFSCFPPQIR